MNERIKTLFIQAGGGVEEENGNLWTYSEDLDPEKFALSVVKECANIVWDEAEKTMSSEVNDAGYKIIEYFGVAESEQ